MKFIGLSASIRYDYEELVRVCDAEPNGTDIPVFDRILRKRIRRFATIKRKYRPTMREAEKWVNHPDRIVVLCYWHTIKDNEYEGHYMIITESIARGLFFRVVNDGPSIAVRDRDRIKTYFMTRSRAKKNVPVAWFIKAGK